MLGGVVMSENTRVFQHNLLNMLNKYNKTQKEVADAIHVSPQTFNTWCQGIAIPRMGKIQLLADYFHVNMSDLIEKHDFESENTADTLPYYISADAREMAQFMFENPEYKVLFDASRKISKEDIETVKAIMDRFKRPDND